MTPIEKLNGSFGWVQYFQFTNEGKFVISNCGEIAAKLDINVYHDSNLDSGSPQDGGINITTYGGSSCSGLTCHTGTFTGRTAGGSYLSPTATSHNQAMAEFTGKGHDGSGFESSNRGVFGVYAAEDQTSTAQGAYCAIQTTKTGESDDHFSFMVDATGNAGVFISQGIPYLTAVL